MKAQLIGQWAMVEGHLVWVWETVESNARQKVVELIQPAPERVKAA